MLVPPYSWNTHSTIKFAWFHNFHFHLIYFWPMCLARQLKEILHHHSLLLNKNHFDLNGIFVGKSYSVDVDFDFCLSSKCAERLELLSKKPKSPICLLEGWKLFFGIQPLLRFKLARKQIQRIYLLTQWSLRPWWLWWPWLWWWPQTWSWPWPWSWPWTWPCLGLISYMAYIVYGFIIESLHRLWMGGFSRGDISDSKEWDSGR